MPLFLLNLKRRQNIATSTVIKKAIASSAKLISPIKNRFYGDRCGSVKDPFGHLWCVVTHIENVTRVMLKKRIAEIKNQIGKIMSISR